MFPHENNYVKGGGVSFSRCPVVTSALLNKRKKEREKKTFPGGEWKPQWEARHFLFSFLPSAVCSYGNENTIEWPHNKECYTLVLHDDKNSGNYSIEMASYHTTVLSYILWYWRTFIFVCHGIYITLQVCQTTWRYQDTRIFLTEINNISLNPYKKCTIITTVSNATTINCGNLQWQKN